jgi:hypothetical protein
MATTNFSAARRVAWPPASPARSGLDGASLTARTWLLLAAGTIGGLLFTAAYLVEGATRAGYDGLAEPISALSLGPGGWMQQLNFALFGVLLAVSATGWRTVLRGGPGAAAFPLLRAIAGVGLIMDGLLSQDPEPGYPPGAQAMAASVHGQLHTLFAMVTITALAGSCLILARRFAAEPPWRRWAAFAVATGVATIVFIAAFGAMGGHGGAAGLCERLAGGVNSLFGLAVLARMLTSARATGGGWGFWRPLAGGSGP